MNLWTTLQRNLEYHHIYSVKGSSLTRRSTNLFSLLYFPQPDYKALQDQSTAAKDYFLDRISSAELSKEYLRTLGTHAKLDRSWYIWELFIQRIELKENPLLDNIVEEDIPTLVRTFEASVR